MTYREGGNGRRNTKTVAANGERKRAMGGVCTQKTAAANREGGNTAAANRKRANRRRSTKTAAANREGPIYGGTQRHQ